MSDMEESGYTVHFTKNARHSLRESRWNDAQILISEINHN